MACDDIYREQMERNIRAAQQLDRADNPCFGGLFSDRQPTIQQQQELMEAMQQSKSAADFNQKWASRMDKVASSAEKKRNHVSAWKALWGRLVAHWTWIWEVA